MTVQIVTGFSPALWKQVGERMVSTFDRHWPANYSIVDYHEEPVSLKRGELRYYADCAGWNDFERRHRDHAEARGLKEPLGRPWRPKEKAGGYSYRFDAYRFCRVAFALEDAAQQCGPGIEFLVWLDGDTYTHADVPPTWIEDLMSDKGGTRPLDPQPQTEVDFATPFRANKHPEIGMQIYRLQNVHARQLIRSFRLMYHADVFMECSEWHTAHILWELAEGMASGKAEAALGLEHIDGLRLGNLSLEPKGHVFATGLPSMYCDHLKGNRKRGLKSRELRQW